MITLLPALFFLVASAAIVTTAASLRRFGRLHTEELLPSPIFFFYYPFNAALFKEKRWEALLFSLGFSNCLLVLCYALSTFLFFFYRDLDTIPLAALCGAAAVYLGVYFLCNFLAGRYPKLSLALSSPFSSLFLFLTAPLSLPLSKLLPEKAALPAPFRVRDKMEELVRESDLSAYLDANEQKLLLSIVSFKERIVREVMVPRINLFCLPVDISLQEAGASFLEEGYSRIPIYQESIDNIIGVLYYKDLFNAYVQAAGQKEHFERNIEHLVKPILYTPETKKISHLLQEFRSKQIHLAIVVDEYGGTEGLVTIEDILEELVGEISDEYDKEEEDLFTILPGGGWILDARMSIIDIEEELGIKIPYSPEYDTIGGYIFHRAGAIPTHGWRVHHDTFDLEILSSNERCIEKIRITPNS